MNLVLDGLGGPLLVVGGFGSPNGGVTPPFICYVDPTAFTVIE